MSESPEAERSSQVNKTESTPQHSPPKKSSNKSKIKLPPLIPRQCYWNGERSNLRPYIKRWHHHLRGAQDEEALMFLQQYVLRAYKYIIQNSSSIIACLQCLEELCTNKRMYPERTTAQRNPRHFHDNKATSRVSFKLGGNSCQNLKNNKREPRILNTSERQYFHILNI